ncbi:MAG: helix-turn-helix transcriptional regulator [Nitriliruptoraceae bacterium]|nr:helix-turn-helix transcriptional regulator [Nitriliruptoraceae bacterium]
MASSAAVDPARPDAPPFGTLLRNWRERRRFSQQELSLAAEVSARHLSFLETGRSKPSRSMVLGLADVLRVPLRERNELLHAAGFAAHYPRRAFDAPELATVHRAVDQVLAGHEPYPAVAVDRAWNLLTANRVVTRLTDGVSPALLGPGANVYRLTLHPDGLAPRIANLDEVGHHLLSRLRHDAEVTGDPGLAGLLAEVGRYPSVAGVTRHLEVAAEVVVPFRLRHPSGELAMFTTVTTFGTPADVTVAELALELFYPLDAATDARLRRLATD